VIRSLGSGGEKCPQRRLTAQRRRGGGINVGLSALKREIVAASHAPGASVSIVARQYDVNANQVFSWPKRYREDACAPSNSTVPQLVPVVITAVAAQPPVVTEKIEIDVSGKYRIRVACGFDGQALRRVLDVLERQ
jgi:transposase